MTKGVSGSTRAAETGGSGLTNLALRQDLPPRVRPILEGVLGLCSSTFGRSVAATLDEFEQNLFKLAEKARSNELSQRYFETMREVKRARADVAPRFLMALEDLLARYDKSTPVSHRRSSPPPIVPRREELSLIATDDFEESLAVQELAGKVEVRQGPALHALGHRFGVLSAMPALDAETLPIGPAKLGEALRYAASSLDIPAEQRVLFYNTFDRIAMREVGTFYDEVNAYFVDQGILRNLKLQPPRLKSASGKDSTEEAAPAPAPAATPEPEAPAEPTPTFRPTRINRPRLPQPSAHSLPGSPPMADHDTPSRAGASAMPEWIPPSGQNAQARQAGAPADSRDSELFETLRELLAGRRHALGGPLHEQTARGFVPTSADVQSVLGSLQAKPVTPMMLNGKTVQRSVAQLKQEMINQLRPLAPAGQTPHLATEDSDTVDLVGMLFDYIGKDLPANSGTQSMLAKLQVPLLRVALRDKSFFTRRAHPARQLLNAIAETGIHWIDDGDADADPTLVKKMQMVIDRVTSEFDGNLGLIEDMLGDLSQHMHTLARKAEMTERRLVDATKGREKLALARETAGAAIADRVNSAKPGRLLRTMLEQAWTDVLALTLLRQGENSETYLKQLAIADQLIEASASTREGASKPPAAVLRQEVETGLSQVGYHNDEIQAVVKRLFVPEEAANDENASQTDLAIKLKSKVRLGVDSADEKPRHAAEVRMKALKLNPEELQMLDRLKTIPFGTWFEFSINQQGERVRRKLSWFSTVTGRCLFVNQRGVRADDRTLEQLARDMVRGQAQIARAEADSLVDRAWKAIVSSLKQITGHDPLPAPA